MAKKDQPVLLHKVVREIAADLELENGKLKMTSDALARHKVRLSKITTAEEKKQVLVSLVALASRLMREGREAAAAAVARVIELAAELIGDPEQARAIFEQAGAAPKKGS